MSLHFVSFLLGRKRGHPRHTPISSVLQHSHALCSLRQKTGTPQSSTVAPEKNSQIFSVQISPSSIQWALVPMVSPHFRRKPSVITKKRRKKKKNFMYNGAPGSQWLLPSRVVNGCGSTHGLATGPEEVSFPWRHSLLAAGKHLACKH